jgi:hypothetical protein
MPITYIEFATGSAFVSSMADFVHLQFYFNIFILLVAGFYFVSWIIKR